MNQSNHIRTCVAIGAVALAISAMVFPAFAEDKKSAAKPYSLEKCIVSDEKLGEMGKPFVFTYEGQEIKLCCKSCQKDFKKDPAKYLKKLKDAEAEKAKSKK